MGLGFSMSKKSYQIIITFVISVLIFSILSCKRAEEEEENLGPAVDTKAVQDVLDEVFSGNTYDNGMTDQFVYYEENISAQGGPPQDRGFDYIKIKNRKMSETDPNFLQFTMHYIRKKLDENGQFQTIETEETYNVNKNAESTMAPLDSGMRILIQSSRLKTMSRTEKPTKITYHNFEVKRGNVLPVPEAVRLRPDCGGISGCRLNSIMIRLDEVKWYGESDYDKMHFDFVYSKDTPYLINIQNDTMGGLMLMGCLSTYIPYQGKKVYVKDCVNLKDFQK